MYNNTVYNCGDGFRSFYIAHPPLYKNNIAQNCTDGFHGPTASDSDYNISDISGDAPGSNSKTCTVSFVDEANDDFHLAVSDTCAKNSGVDLSSDANLAFSDDIDGKIRPGGTAWDIGADELKKAIQINTSITNKFTSGLVGNWTFNGPDIDWSTNTAYDRSGQGNNGTIYGAKQAIGKVGQALEFDGVNDYVEVLDDNSLDITDAITIETWVKVNPGSSALQALVEKGGWEAGEYGLYAAASWSPLNGEATFQLYDLPDDCDDALVGTDIRDGIWHHLVGVWDGSTIYLYLDGELDNSISCSGTLTTNNKNLYFGSRLGNQRYFNGLIDEVRIYNRALSAEEIAEHYRVGARKFKIDPTKSGKTIIK